MTMMDCGILPRMERMSGHKGIPGVVVSIPV